MKKRKIAGILVVTAALALTGCQKNPEGSIVTNKDFNKMVEQAEDTQGGTSDVGSLATAYDVYQTTVSNESLGVTVNVDAKVDIPTTNTMSVVRVRQKEISQEFLDKAVKALMPGINLYEGRALNVPTKDSIEDEIQNYKEEIRSVQAQGAEGVYDQESVDIMVEEYQRSIDALQEKYEQAPDSVPLEDYPSDGQLHPVKELLEENPEDDYILWQNDLNPEGAIFYGASDGKDGTCRSIYVQNNENYGNCLRFRSSPNGYMHISSVAVDGELGQGSMGLWDASKAPEEGDLQVEGDFSEAREVENEPANLSEAEARELAESLLGDLGLAEYGCYSGGLYCEVIDTPEGADGIELSYRKEYIFRYLRNIDGAFVNNEGWGKLSEGWSGDEYQKRMWSGESVTVYVNDSGIVGFDYLTPMETVETVVDQAAMKSFDEIKDIFEQMIVVTNAVQEGTISIDVDRVELRYTRISEADSFDTGLLVPVWDFEGTLTLNSSGEAFRKGVLLSVNAIDGSVIDRELGY